MSSSELLSSTTDVSSNEQDAKNIAGTVQEVYRTIKTMVDASDNTKASSSIKPRKKKPKCPENDEMARTKIERENDEKPSKKPSVQPVDEKKSRKIEASDDEEMKQARKKRACDETSDKPEKKVKKTKKCDNGKCSTINGQCDGGTDEKNDGKHGIVEESPKKRQKRERDNGSDDREEDTAIRCEKKSKKSDDCKMSNVEAKSESKNESKTESKIEPKTESKIRRVQFVKIDDNSISDFELVEVRLLEKMLAASTGDTEKNIPKIRKPPPANVIVLAIRSIGKFGIPPNDGITLRGHIYTKPSVLCGIDIHVYGNDELQTSYTTSLIDEKRGGFQVYVRNISLGYKDIAIGDVVGYLELRTNDETCRISVL